MKFLSQADASAMKRRFEREIEAAGAPRRVLYRTGDGRRDPSRTAATIAISAGRFSEATVLFTWALDGDGWDETSAGYGAWEPYRRWRAAHGELRRLYEAPAHHFGPDEAAEFAEIIDYALQLGWDAVVAAKPNRQLLLISHDDRIEIYRGFGGGVLVRELLDHGCWRTAEPR